MFAQLKENLIHFKGGGNGLDQHRGLDRAAGDSKLRLAHAQDVIPEPGLLVAFDFRQIEIRARATGNQLLGIVVEINCEIENSARDPSAIYKDMLFIQMPAAWPHQQHRGFLIELIGLAVLLKPDGATNRIPQIDLALNLVVPVRGIGVLEVGHEGVCARVQGIDDHLALNRAGNFHTAALQILWQLADLPIRVANGCGVLLKIGPQAQIKALGDQPPGLEQFLAAMLK